MGLLDRLHRSKSDSSTPGPDDHGYNGRGSDEKRDPIDAPNLELDSSDDESIRSGNYGVKKAQATTIVWTRNALLIAYGL